jgi:hypothetical protein
MLRRNSGRGFAIAAGAAALLWIPIASASVSHRAVQTLTLTVLTLTLAGAAIAWLILVRRGYVRSAHLAIGALAGVVASLLPAMRLSYPSGTVFATIAAQVLLIGVFDVAGLWLMIIALRRIFPRRSRGVAAAGFALLMLGVFPAPLLLTQPAVASLNLIDPRNQLRAGFAYWTIGAVLLVAPFLALATLPGDWFERGWRALTSRVMAISNARFAIGVVGAALALALLFSFYSFAARPTTADEIAQIWHARMLLEGRLAMPPDPNPEFFGIDNVVDRDVWMSQFPIGGPAVLALGLLVGAVWLVNPVLTAFTALNVYRFAQRAFGEAQARAAAAVFVASPMVLLMGASHMNHTPTAWLITLALATLPVWVATSELRRLRRAAIIIGLSVGAALTIRPLDATVAAVVFGVTMLAASWSNPVRARSLPFAIAAGAIPLSLLLAANWATTGAPLRFGYEVLWGANHSLGLHDDPTGHPHTPWRAFVLGVKYLAQLNWIVEAWPIPILVIVAVGLMFMRRPRRWDRLLIASVGAQAVVYSFYWHDGQFVGPRFLFTAIPALLILTARAPFIVADRVQGSWRRIALILIPVCIAVSWLRSMPPFGVQGIAGEFRESRKRLKMDPPPQVRDGIVANALIFVQEGAATRLLRRLWGIGVSRADAARLLEVSDACSLLEAVRAEERRGDADSVGRVRRLEANARRFVASSANLRVPDRNFLVSDTTVVTPACAREIAHDRRIRNTVAFGPMLLENRFDDAGRIAGPAIYVMDLGERNEILRPRFGSRRWFRYEVPFGRADTAAALVPYAALP